MSSRNKTKKNKKNALYNCFSEGFIRRMTDDITFTPCKPEEYEELNKRFKRLEALRNNGPVTDNEIEEEVNNSAKLHAEYLESVKNGTNKF